MSWYNALAGACAEQKANSATAYNLADFDGVTPVGINYNFTQEDNSGANAGTNIITGIAVTTDNFYLSNTGDGGTFDSGTEQVRKLTLDNSDGIIAQLDAVNAITTTAGLRDMDMDSTGKRILFGGNTSHDVYAAEYNTAEDITTTLTGKGTLLNPLGSHAVNAVCWSNDGTRIAVGTGISSSNNQVKSYSLSTAYSLASTPSLIGTKTISDASSNGAITGIKFNDDGTKVYLSQNKAIREYVLSTPYDVSTIGSVNYTLDLSTYVNERNLGPIYSPSPKAELINGFDWSPDGRTLYCTTAFGGTVTGQITGTPGPEIINGGKSHPAPDTNTFPVFSISI
tara:strand:- start:45 stop:1064 length:1020 start_codon:yes stop_codon:yes gene_type:complete